MNRLTEPFTRVKIVCTATEWDNFFSLRCHPDAQPEIQDLATRMYKAMSKSTPEYVDYGQWHLPYVDDNVKEDACRYFIETQNCQYKLDQILLMVSASCCAQVSYRTLDTSIDKSIRIYERLIGSKPVHASPFEHQASPIHSDYWYHQGGVTHMSVDDNSDDEISKYWSGNFRGWIQHRHLIPDNTCYRFEGLN